MSSSTRPADGLDAELEQQVDRGAEREDARRVGRALLEAARAGLQIEVVAIEVQVVRDAAPADHARREPLDQRATAEEQAAALHREQPLVAVRRQEVDVALRDVEREAAEALDGIDAEEHAALAAQAPERREVVARAAAELDRGEREQARARVSASASSTLSSGSAPSRPRSITVSTPRGRRLHHAYTFEGYSRSQITTRSPRCQSSPAATRPRPSLVFFTKAISSAARADQLGGAPAHALDLRVVGARVVEGALLASPPRV